MSAFIDINTKTDLCKLIYKAMEAGEKIHPNAQVHEIAHFVAGMTTLEQLPEFYEEAIQVLIECVWQVNADEALSRALSHARQ